MYKNILLPVDLNHDSSWQKALPMAIDHCKTFGATLHIMTVVPDFGMPLVASYFPENFETKVREDANRQLHDFVKAHVGEAVPVQHIVAEGVFYKEIIRVAEEIDADLIIMASHHPELKDYLLEPNAERVVRHSDKSVLVVRN